ncbi:hypothetical protein [Halococcus sp. AFM35]|uniref:hypothetical protein n=1 Tax=Halococcus sp. AFM35 TaxID=3421653 RepID=UPI003EB71716
MSAPFGATWGTLIERCEELPEDATLITPLSTGRFRVTGHQIVTDWEYWIQAPENTVVFATRSELVERLVVFEQLRFVPLALADSC